MFLKMAYVFMKIGFLTVGGGLAMIPIVQHELESRGWLTSTEFLEILGVSQMTPGPLSLNAATFVGYRLTAATYPGFWIAALGALLCTLSLCLPSVLCVNAFAGFLDRYRGHPCLQRVFDLLRPVVTGLVSTAAISLVVCSLWGDQISGWNAYWSTAPDYKALGIVVLAFGFSAFTKTSPVLILFGGILIGLLFF